MIHKINAKSMKLPNKLFSLDEDDPSICLCRPWAIETWSKIPTFAIISESIDRDREFDGATYHDIPLEALGVECYHPWEYLKIEEAPVIVPIPHEFANLFSRERELICEVKVIVGLCWPANNVLLYLCQDNTHWSEKKLYLWPVHKLLFSSLGTELPNWKKKR